jgi:hypothetical protein
MILRDVRFLSYAFYMWQAVELAPILSDALDAVIPSCSYLVLCEKQLLAEQTIAMVGTVISSMMEPLVAPGRYCYEPVFCLCGAFELVRAVQSM